ncbi:MAG: alpha/beta hydrolase [Pigmentiphaga sp.]
MSSNVESVIARIRAVYGSWNRQTTVAQMRDDWDRLFAMPTEASVTPVLADTVPCAWVRAPGVRTDQVIVYFHGGGFRVGSLRSHGELMARLSAAAGVQVLGVDYRLAPEHRYPAPHQDAERVLQWLRGQGYSGGKLALAGDSAGGGLVLCALLAIRERDGINPAAAFVMSAWTDLAATGASYDTRAEADPIHQRAMIQAMARGFLGPEADPREPRASPLYAKASHLGGLPPLLLQVGDRETVLSDSEEFARRVQEAGGTARLEVWPEMIHVFQQFPAELAEAVQAIEAGGRFLAGHLRPQSTGEASS